MGLVARAEAGHGGGPVHAAAEMDALLGSTGSLDLIAAEEIAMLASAAAPGGGRETSMSVRLVGIARWLHGERQRVPGAASW